MQITIRLFLAVGLVAFGYFLGSAQVFRTVQADQEDELPSDDAVKKIGDAYGALKSAAQQLITESRYSSVTKAINPYAVLVGGLNVKEDLESGRGVDPETFAALNVAAYDLKKGTSTEEPADTRGRQKDKDKDKESENLLADWIDPNLLGYDSNGRLTYRNKVVKVYSISKLRRLNAQRLVVLSGTKDNKPAR